MAATRAGGMDMLEREVFSMAGGEAGKLVTDQRFIEELVNTMGSWIEAQDLDKGNPSSCG